MVTVLSNASSTGDAVATGGGHFVFRAESDTWNGATLQLQLAGPNDNWIDIVSASLTADGAFRVYLPGNVNVRGEITGSPTGVYADLAPMGE